MPGYGLFGNNPPALYQGDSYYFWNNESPAVGSQSQEVAIAVIPGKDSSLAIEIVFSGAPGVFEIDVQRADTDVAGDYVELTSVNAVDANNVARIEISPLIANFVRLSLVALANAVTTTAKGTLR